MQPQDFDPNNLTPEEKYSLSKELRDLMNSSIQQASQRTSELSDEFTRLEVQIATILFAFAGLFLGDFKDGALSTFSPSSVLLLRLSFAVGITFLIASLVAGLLQIKRKEKFWNQMLSGKVAIMRHWNSATRKEISFDNARAFQLGIAQGEEGAVFTPPWAWILQTIFLGIGVGFLFVLALVLLFQ